VSLSLHVKSVRRTWREGSSTGNSESYIRYVKEGFGYGASPSLYRLKECGKAPITGLCESRNGRLLKRSISYTGLH